MPSIGMVQWTRFKNDKTRHTMQPPPATRLQKPGSHKLDDRQPASTSTQSQRSVPKPLAFLRAPGQAARSARIARVGAAVTLQHLAGKIQKMRRRALLQGQGASVDFVDLQAYECARPPPPGPWRSRSKNENPPKSPRASFSIRGARREPEASLSWIAAYSMCFARCPWGQLVPERAEGRLLTRAGERWELKKSKSRGAADKVNVDKPESKTPSPWCRSRT